MPTMRTVRTSRPGVTGQAEAEFPDPPHAFRLALTPGAAEKVTVNVGH